MTVARRWSVLRRKKRTPGNRLSRARYLKNGRVAMVNTSAQVRNLSDSAKPLAYVIWRKNHVGLTALIGSILRGLQVSEWLNAKPFVDLESFHTAYSEDELVNGSRNVWEYFFEPVSEVTREAIEAGRFRVIAADGAHPHIEGSHDETDYRQLWARWVRPNPTLAAHWGSCAEEVGPSNATIAVHFRAGDMRGFRNHPMPATIDQTLAATRFLLDKGSYDRVFLATQEEQHEAVFRREFGKRLLSLENFRPSNRSEKNMTPFLTPSVLRRKDSSPRPQHFYRLGLEVLSDAWVMAQCGALVAGSSNVALLARVMRDHPHQDQIWIWNGFNGRSVTFNKLRWLWKSAAPEKAGGFRTWSQDWVHQPGSPGPR